MMSFYRSSLFVEGSSRLASLALSFLFAFFLSLLHSLELFYLFVSPVIIEEIKFLFIDLTEALKTTLHLCTIAASVQTFLYLLYHFWCWSVVGRYPWERKKLGLSALYFAITGPPPMIAFYYWGLPQMCQFFLDLEISTPAFTIELDSRVSTYITLIIQIILFLTIFYYLPWLQ